MRKEQVIKPALRIACLIICTLTIAFTHSKIRSIHLNVDGSYNMQTAVSLASEGVYKSLHRPQMIYDRRITTNGPMQYLMAAGIKLWGMETGQTIVLTLLFAVFIAAIYLHSPFVAVIFCGLQFLWPTLAHASGFTGEQTAIALCLYAIWFLEKALDRSKKDRLSGDLIASGVLFGMAISTKLIAAFLLPLLLGFAVFDRSRQQRKELYLTSLKVSGIALFTFVFLYYFSVAHSFLFHQSNTTQSEFDQLHWRGFYDFVTFHFRKYVAANAKTHFFSNPGILYFLIGCIALLFVENKFVVIIASACLGMQIFGYLDERRMLPFLFFLAFLGCRQLVWLLSRTRLEKLSRPNLLGLVLITTGLAATVFFSLKPVPATFRYRRDFGNMEDIAKWVTEAKYPIITEGWWHVPELSLKTSTNFYDRTAPENQAMRSAFPVLYLLVDKDMGKAWQALSKLCVKKLFEDKNFVFCEFNKEVPLNFIADK